LVATTVLEQRDPNGGLLLDHPRIFFPSYPWEWTPGAWVAAAELTLSLCEALVPRGLILKDATPLNVLFEGPRPVFVDVLSIEERDPASPLWMAYAQFVRTFLLPLAAYRYLGWPLSASFHRRDGYQPADLYPYLSSIQRWREPLRRLVTLPYLLEKRRGNVSGATKVAQDPEVAQAVLRRNLRALRVMLQKLSGAEPESVWSDYPENADHYAEEDHQQKRTFVRRALLEIAPKHVLDLGANTGVYSRMAASTGAGVVAWDTDLAASEINWQQAYDGRREVQAVIADTARPTPAAGWRNAETLGLLERAYGRFDCVMMLGLVHHLLLSDQIPLGEIAGLLRDLTTRWAIVEWIPPSDPKFAEMMRGREEIYGHLKEAEFATTLDRYFVLAQKAQLKNGRTLYLLELR
jgi:SAM-dependent methyltransferase